MSIEIAVQGLATSAVEFNVSLYHQSHSKLSRNALPPFTTLSEKSCVPVLHRAGNYNPVALSHRAVSLHRILHG